MAGLNMAAAQSASSTVTQGLKEPGKTPSRNLRGLFTTALIVLWDKILNLTNTVMKKGGNKPCLEEKTRRVLLSHCCHVGLWCMAGVEDLHEGIKFKLRIIYFSISISTYLPFRSTDPR